MSVPKMARSRNGEPKPELEGESGHGMRDVGREKGGKVAVRQSECCLETGGCRSGAAVSFTSTIWE